MSVIRLDASIDVTDAAMAEAVSPRSMHDMVHTRLDHMLGEKVMLLISRDGATLVSAPLASEEHSGPIFMTRFEKVIYALPLQGASEEDYTEWNARAHEAQVTRG